MSGRVHPPYTAPPDAPVRFAFRFAALVVLIPVVVLAMLLLPDGPVWVSLRALIVLAAVGVGVGAVMTRRRDLERAPRPRPRSPEDPTPS